MNVKRALLLVPGIFCFLLLPAFGMEQSEKKIISILIWESGHGTFQGGYVPVYLFLEDGVTVGAIKSLIEKKQNIPQARQKFIGATSTPNYIDYAVEEEWQVLGDDNKLYFSQQSNQQFMLVDTAKDLNDLPENLKNVLNSQSGLVRIVDIRIEKPKKKALHID